MEELLNYLIEQRRERCNKLSAYEDAVSEYEKAKERVEAFGDMAGVRVEIEKLDGFIESVAHKVGAVEDTVEAIGGGENEAFGEAQA